MHIEVANRLHQLRKQHNLSQEELASKIGISRQAVSKWERAEASPDTDNLIALAKLYNVSLDDLLTSSSVSLENDEPISLKKDGYSSIGNVTSSYVSDDGEIYPQNTYKNESFTENKEKTFTAENQNKSNENLFGNSNNPYANNANSQNYQNNQSTNNSNFEKFNEFGKVIGDSLESGLGNLDKLGVDFNKIGKIVGENIDKAGQKIQEEIKKSEEKNTTFCQTTSKTCNNNFQPNQHIHNVNKNKASINDILFCMLMVLAFAFTVTRIEEAAITFLMAIPTLITAKAAIKSRNLLIFCYPTFIVMLFFGLTIFGRWTYDYTWTLFLTIPLFYTLIPAIKKRNPLIFCYPVLTAYIFCLTLLFFNGVFASVTWPIFLTIPFYYIIFGKIMHSRKHAGNK